MVSESLELVSFHIGISAKKGLGNIMGERLALSSWSFCLIAILCPFHLFSFFFNEKLTFIFLFFSKKTNFLICHRVNSKQNRNWQLRFRNHDSLIASPWL